MIDDDDVPLTSLEVAIHTAALEGVRAARAPVPLPNKSPVPQAEREGEQVAFSFVKMLERVTGLQLSISKRVTHRDAESDAMQLKVQGMLPGARIVGQELNDDGTFELTFEGVPNRKP
ncbi:MAG: hypothetical protein K1X64_20440 [Myxococcaceae bacterium]|nr:hypothetical protein [Myxococcaceae bacterium]